MKKLANLLMNILLLTGVFFSFHGCQKESFNFEKEPDNPKIQYIKSEEVKQNNHLGILSERLKDKFSSSISKTSDKGPLTINTDWILKVENETSTVYTFLVEEQLNKTSLFENLVVEKKVDNSFSIFLFQYYINPQGTKENPYKAKITKLDYETLNIQLNLKVITTNDPCIEVTYYPCGCGGNADGHEPSGAPCCEGSQVASIELVDCFEGSGGGGGDVDYNEGTTGEMGDYGDGGYGGGGGSYPTSDIGMITNLYNDLIFELADILQIDLTTGSGINWENGIRTYLSVYNLQDIWFLLLDNDYSQDAINFAEEIINQMIKTKLKFDINRSYKSPVNIDLTSIDTSTPEGQKLKCVYDKLTQSASFKELFLNTFGKSDRVNVCLHIQDLGNTGINGNTGGEIIKYSNGETYINNVITINSQILNGSKSNFQIARTIIHEFIHAYLNNINNGCQNYFTLPVLNNLDLPELIDEYYKQGCSIDVKGVDQSEHAFMFDHMIPAFEKIFSELQSALTSQSSIDYVKDLSLYYIDDKGISQTIPNKTFNWEEFYHYFSMAGLDYNDAFIDTIKNDNDEYSMYRAYIQISKNCQ